MSSVTCPKALCFVDLSEPDRVIPLSRNCTFVHACRLSHIVSNSTTFYLMGKSKERQQVLKCPILITVCPIPAYNPHSVSWNAY